VSSGRVYAVAHDRGRGAQRVFALDNISKPRIAPQHYAIPDDFDLEAFAARSVSGIMHSETVTTVTVRYSKVVARAAKADRVVRERTIRERRDGDVEIDYTVESTDEFLRWVLKWGAEAIVVGPPPIRAAAATLARAIAARYKRR
jgi:predicted DNA-binding transcriptional regulator YafY